MRFWMATMAYMCLLTSTQAADAVLSFRQKLDAPVTREFVNMRLDDVLNILQKESGVAIRTQAPDVLISLIVHDVPLMTTLDHLATISGLDLRYRQDCVQLDNMSDDQTDMVYIESPFTGASAAELEEYAELITMIFAPFTPSEYFECVKATFCANLSILHRISFMDVHRILSGNCKVTQENPMKSVQASWKFHGNMVNAAESIRKTFGLRVLLSRGALAQAITNIEVEADNAPQALRNICRELDLVWDDRLDTAFIRTKDEPVSPVIRVYRINEDGQFEQIQRLASDMRDEDYHPVIRRWRNHVIVKALGGFQRSIIPIVGTPVQAVHSNE